MDKNRAPILECLAVASLLVMAATVIFVLFPSMQSSDTAAWVQAVGSVVAIGVAVWLPHRQHKQDLEREKQREQEEVRSMLNSLRDEMSNLWDAFETKIGQDLANSQAGTAFEYFWPAPDRPFVIYDACVDRVGKIQDDRLRQLIIITYARAMGLVYSFKMNNLLVEKHERASTLANQTMRTADMTAAMQAHTVLRKYGDGLRSSRMEVKAHVEALLEAMPK